MPINPALLKKSVRYLLLARFSTDIAAPLPASLPVDIGGPLTTRQSNGNMSVANSKLHMPAGAVASFGNLGWYALNRGRIAGQALFATFDITTLTDHVPIAWSKAASISFGSFANIGSGVYLSTTTPRIVDDAAATSNVLAANLSTSTVYQVVLIQQLAGGALITIEGGIFARPTLLYVTIGDTTSNQYPATSNAQAVYDIDTAGVVPLTGAYATAYGLAAARTATPTDGATLATPIEFNTEFTWTPVAGETLEFDLRRVDSDNRWIVRCAEATVPTLGSTIKLIEREDGSEVQVSSTAQTFTAGTPYRICVAAPAGWYSVAVNGTNKIAYTVPGQTPVNLYGTGVKVAGFTTGSNLVVYPRKMSQYTFGLNKPITSWLTLGDSKAISTGWPPSLRAALVTAYPAKAFERIYPQIDTGGITWAGRRATIDADLATVEGTPTFALINVGVNDAVVLPVEATMKADMSYVLDAIRTKWPSIAMRLMLVGRTTYEANCITVNGWMQDVVSARTDDIVIAGNEIVWLKGADNYATNTTDGIHYSAAGITAAVGIWKTAMGL